MKENPSPDVDDNVDESSEASEAEATPAAETPAEPGRKRSRMWRGLGIGCAAIALLGIAVPSGGMYYWKKSSDAAHAARLKKKKRKAREAFDPVFEAFEQAEPDYDIDKTIRVMHELDRALAEKPEMEGYLTFVATQDYSDVAPEVLQARKDILDIQRRLYALQTEIEDEQEVWEMTSDLMLKTMSVVGVTANANPLKAGAKVKLDHKQAGRLLKEMKQEEAHRRRLMKNLESTEAELVDALFKYSEVYYKYIDEWDQLSVMRDRAYLAANNQDWPATQASATIASNTAPHEKEAHLLLAMSLIEQSPAEGPFEEEDQVMELLSDYIEEHPESSAPAFLLLGVAHGRAGRDKEAQLAFQQSAAYYPKQAEQLTDMLDPYKNRSFLRKSREGGLILHLYKSTMLGAGYFSPDLQMASMLFENGDFDGGRAKVLDHFARRRTQQQWDFIISDIQFCHELLGPDYWKIFPEDHYLDLEVSPTMWGGGINLAVNNRSPKSLHNATLVLALHLTDMYPGDYEAVTAEATVPAVIPHDRTDFGTLELEVDLWGQKKGVNDVVQHRAILISNEAVVWVDTDAFKIAEAEEFRQRRRQARAAGEASVHHPATSRHPDFAETIEALTNGAAEAAQLEVVSRYGHDDVVVKLPRELAILRPVFRLEMGEQRIAPTGNKIDGDHIELTFAKVDNFDDGENALAELKMHMGTPFGDHLFTWTWWDGDDGSYWWFRGMTDA